MIYKTHSTKKPKIVDTPRGHAIGISEGHYRTLAKAIFVRCVLGECEIFWRRSDRTVIRDTLICRAAPAFKELQRHKLDSLEAVLDGNISETNLSGRSIAIEVFDGQGVSYCPVDS